VLFLTFFFLDLLRFFFLSETNKLVRLQISAFGSEEQTSVRRGIHPGSISFALIIFIIITDNPTVQIC
jgi:hypothetical protein